MSPLTKRISLALLLTGIAVGAPSTTFAQSTRQIQQEERLVNTLLIQNQFRINADQNAIARQNALLAILPGETGAARARTIAQINRLNVVIQSSKPPLINGLDRTDTAITTLESASPSNPFIAHQLELYLGRVNTIFSAELQEAELILNRQPATPASFGSPVNPLGLPRSAAAQRAAIRQSMAAERAVLREERRPR